MMASENNNNKQRQYSYYVCVYLANFKYLFVRFLFLWLWVFCLAKSVLSINSIWRKQPIDNFFLLIVSIGRFSCSSRRRLQNFRFHFFIRLSIGKSAAYSVRMWVVCLQTVCFFFGLDCVYDCLVVSSRVILLIFWWALRMIVCVVNNITTVFACLWTLNECPDFELNFSKGNWNSVLGFGMGELGLVRICIMLITFGCLWFSGFGDPTQITVHRFRAQHTRTTCCP